MNTWDINSPSVKRPIFIFKCTFVVLKEQKVFLQLRFVLPTQSHGSVPVPQACWVAGRLEDVTSNYSCQTIIVCRGAPCDVIGLGHVCLGHLCVSKSLLHRAHTATQTSPTVTTVTWCHDCHIMLMLQHKHHSLPRLSNDTHTATPTVTTNI